MKITFELDFDFANAPSTEDQGKLRHAVVMNIHDTLSLLELDADSVESTVTGDE